MSPANPVKISTLGNDSGYLTCISDSLMGASGQKGQKRYSMKLWTVRTRPKVAASTSQSSSGHHIQQTCIVVGNLRVKPAQLQVLLLQGRSRLPFLPKTGCRQPEPPVIPQPVAGLAADSLHDSRLSALQPVGWRETRSKPGWRSTTAPESVASVPHTSQPETQRGHNG